MTLWGAQAFVKLAWTSVLAPALFIPSEHLQHTSKHWRWWKGTGHSKITNHAISMIQFNGKWLPDTGKTAAALTQEQISTLILEAPTILYTITTSMTAEDLGKPPEGQLFHIVHFYWMS